MLYNPSSESKFETLTSRRNNDITRAPFLAPTRPWLCPPVGTPHRSPCFDSHFLTCGQSPHQSPPPRAAQEESGKEPGSPVPHRVQLMPLRLVGLTREAAGTRARGQLVPLRDLVSASTASSGSKGHVTPATLPDWSHSIWSPWTPKSRVRGLLNALCECRKQRRRERAHVAFPPLTPAPSAPLSITCEAQVQT